MIRKILFVFTAVVSLGLVWSCKEEAVPLDEEQFKSLLIDMHRVDGTLAVARRTGGSNDLKNYAYYNDLFKKYGVTRADFDSCLHYYSAQNARFSALYDAIVDSLNKEVTVLDKIIDELKANDSVNYFPTLLDTAALDTLRLDSSWWTASCRACINLVRRCNLILSRGAVPGVLFRFLFRRMARIPCM